MYAFTSTLDRLVAAAVQKAAHIKLGKNGSNEGSRRTVGLRRIGEFRTLTATDLVGRLRGVIRAIYSCRDTEGMG